MKRRLSMALVAVVAIGSLGTYVAHARPDGEKASQSLKLNITTEVRRRPVEAETNG